MKYSRCGAKECSVRIQLPTIVEGGIGGNEILDGDGNGFDGDDVTTNDSGLTVGTVGGVVSMARATGVGFSPSIDARRPGGSGGVDVVVVMDEPERQRRGRKPTTTPMSPMGGAASGRAGRAVPGTVLYSK